MNLVDLARVERASSTFAESRSNSIELQILVFDMLFEALAKSQFVDLRMKTTATTLEPGATATGPIV